MHTLTFPLGFWVATMLDTHWVGLSSFSSTPRLSRRSSSSLSLPFTATGTRRGGITTGGTVLSTSKCSLPSILPRPLNRSAYSARTCSSVRLLMLSSMILYIYIWTKKWIYIKFAQRKGIANISLLQSKPVANVVKSTFATLFAHQCKHGSKCGLYHVCYRFALEQRYVCNTFALCKFNVNPFFRPGPT